MAGLPASSAWVSDALGKTVTRDQMRALMEHTNWQLKETTGEAGYYFKRASDPKTLNHRKRLMPMLELPN